MHAVHAVDELCVLLNNMQKDEGLVLFLPILQTLLLPPTSFWI